MMSSGDELFSVLSGAIALWYIYAEKVLDEPNQLDRRRSAKDVAQIELSHRPSVYYGLSAPPNSAFHTFAQGGGMNSDALEPLIYRRKA
jgi:hypothetical protein